METSQSVPQSPAALPPNPLSLVQAAKQGDDTAFSVLLEPLLEQGRRLAVGMLHDRQAAEDAVQEAAVKAWRKLGQLRAGTEMRPWFLGIVANECRMTRRKRWWSVVALVQSVRSTAEPAESVVSGVAIRRALRSMDHKKRLVLVLRWYLDMSLPDIALVTHSTVHAVEGRFHRGMKELRHSLEDQTC